MNCFLWQLLSVQGFVKWVEFGLFLSSFYQKIDTSKVPLFRYIIKMTACAVLLPISVA
jgi:hypothetical protein